jgi:hypothetical protein
MQRRPTSPLTTAPASDGGARISFRKPVTEVGFVNAGWWPRSRDLAVELPPLLDMLWTACRDVTRVCYDLAFWDPAPRRLQVEGASCASLDSGGQDAWLVTPDSSRREHIDGLAIALEADADFAERVLTRPAGVGSIERPPRSSSSPPCNPVNAASRSAWTWTTIHPSSRKTDAGPTPIDPA